ncbi:hypothetical protein [Legionella clemsonensis]|uniref:Uncharacterized protein n=1 Tax=Legionella clemsonensis TaxID=1867846 RepID=A0A222P417_9GAMM|nr:hypothetical protein [Legionella clemsonensis]ASQ46594.1 hypothetical protein clem_10225 [Legionella clemsonensis]
MPREFQIDETSLCNFLAKKQLYYVFGGEKIKESIQKQGVDIVSLAGGFAQDVIPFLQQTLTQFAAGRGESKQKEYKRIIELLNNYRSLNDIIANIDDVTKDLLHGKPLLTHSGHSKHTVGVTIERQGSDMVLSIAERGAWAETIGDEGNIPIANLRFKADETQIKAVLSLLMKAQCAEAKEAKTIIFEELPKTTQSSFRKENNPEKLLVCKCFKAPICFYANIKTAVHDWFVRTMGLREGQREYKQYEIFSRQQAVEDYKQYVPKNEQDPELLEQCDTIIKKKEEKVKGS